MVLLERGAVIAGRYQVEEPIGSGAHASVYRVYDRTLARSVAAKFLLVHDERRREWLTQRFLREARIAAAVEHPNVVRTLDFGTHEQRAYMVMELLEGESLGKRLDREPPLSLDETVDIVCGVLAGLAAVHRAGIVHRDLKPDNIILIDEGGRLEPRIVDFGVSRAMRATDGVRSAFTTREGLLVGTPEYMAPEQARGLADVDERVDIYAAGVILYEALTGRLPYEALT